MPRIRTTLGWVVTATVLGTCPPGAYADTVITDFNSASLGSYNPRENWLAFGTGTTDSGVRADGSAGRGAYHSVDWDSSGWGVGEVSTVVVDLSSYSAIRVDARMVDLGGHSGTALLRFALDLPGGEWTTPTVSITSSYATYTFDFVDLSGSGSLDLSAGQPKFIIEKNGQGGSGRFDFDEVVAVDGGGGPYALTPVALNPPPDGDAIRAMWFYAGSEFNNTTQSQAILDFCAREGVNRINCGAYGVWALGDTEVKDNLHTFIAAANTSGIRMEALLDGTDWQDNPALVRTRIDQILDFHDLTPGSDDDFAAIHFDVEFWLDPAWDGNEAQRQQVARNYLDNVLVNARDHLDSNGAGDIDIAVDLSTYFDSANMLPSPFLYDGVTQYFIEHVLDHCDDIVLMSYVDSAASLRSVTGYELDLAAGKGRTIQCGVDIQPVPPELSVNSFADNSPTGFSAMTVALEDFHTLLTSSRLGALDGFSVFHYGNYSALEPDPRNIADWDADGDADLADFESFAAHMSGPNVDAEGLARDADFDLDGDVDLADFSLLARCFTGSGVTGPIPDDCLR